MLRFEIINAGGDNVKRIFSTGVILLLIAWSALAQDWYREREERFRGEQWRAHLFEHVDGEHAAILGLPLLPLLGFLRQYAVLVG